MLEGAAESLVAEAKSRALYIFRARTLAVCGCVRNSMISGSLQPDKGHLCMAWPDDFEKGKQCLMQPRRQPTPSPLPRKDSGLTVRLRTITGMHIRSLAAAVGTTPKSPRTLSKAKQGAGASIYTSRVCRARARCRVRNVRIRANVHGFRRDSARPLHERCTGSQEKAPLLGCRSKEPRPLYLLRARFAHARVAGYGMYGFVRTCTDSAGIPRGRCTSGVRGARRKRRSSDAEARSPAP